MKRFSLPHKNEFRRILSSRHFRSTLCLSLIICTLLYFLIVAFVVRQLSDTMTDKAVGTANAVCADMQGTLSAIQSNAVSISSLKSVKEIVNLEHPSLDDYVDVSSDLSAFSSTIDYESVDIFFLKPRRVYVSRMGMYEFSDYPGRDLIALIEENSIMGAKWLVGRNYVRYYSEQYPIPVATYLLRLPIDSSDGSGFIAIHLSFETVSRLIEARRQPGYGILLSYQGCRSTAPRRILKAPAHSLRTRMPMPPPMVFCPPAPARERTCSAPYWCRAPCCGTRSCPLCPLPLSCISQFWCCPP